MHVIKELKYDHSFRHVNAVYFSIGQHVWHFHRWFPRRWAFIKSPRLHLRTMLTCIQFKYNWLWNRTKTTFTGTFILHKSMNCHSCPSLEGLDGLSGSKWPGLNHERISLLDMIHLSWGRKVGNILRVMHTIVGQTSQAHDGPWWPMTDFVAKPARPAVQN